MVSPTDRAEQENAHRLHDPTAIARGLHHGETSTTLTAAPVQEADRLHHDATTTADALLRQHDSATAMQGPQTATDQGRVRLREEMICLEMIFSGKSRSEIQEIFEMIVAS